MQLFHSSYKCTAVLNELIMWLPDLHGAKDQRSIATQFKTDQNSADGIGSLLNFNSLSSTNIYM